MRIVFPLNDAEIVIVSSLLTPWIVSEPVTSRVNPAAKSVSLEKSMGFLISNFAVGNNAVSIA